MATKTETCGDETFGVLGSLDIEIAAWFLTLSGGYDWIADPIDVRIGPGLVSFDTSGRTVALALGRPL